MGAPNEWIEQRQEQQVQQVMKAYTDIQPLSEKSKFDSFSEIKPDGIDYAYTWARTFTPSWVMALIFIAGLITLIPFFLKRFGINLKIEKGK